MTITDDILLLLKNSSAPISVYALVSTMRGKSMAYQNPYNELESLVEHELARMVADGEVGRVIVDGQPRFRAASVLDQVAAAANQL